MTLADMFGVIITGRLVSKHNRGHVYFRGPSVVIRLTCDCAVADDAVMPIRTESSS